MDRNAINNVNLSYEEIVSILSTQIGQLTAELLATKAVLKKTQDLLEKSAGKSEAF